MKITGDQLLSLGFLKDTLKGSNVYTKRASNDKGYILIDANTYQIYSDIDKENRNDYSACREIISEMSEIYGEIGRILLFKELK